ncbi:MAG: phenylalanine--tRNA ligase subunit beta, partial [Synergistota bacterium]|nr:phenylalanine--tRNA ligase subunit beta [Synergistota bacterium]
MLISWNLLNEILAIPASLEEVAERLTLTGCEVESIDYPCARLEGVLSAVIEKLERHPARENLYVATVEDGAGSALVATAAPNLSEGDVVPWGRPGAVLADGSVLGTRDFDGVESQGMLLSASELGVPEVADEFGILRLPADTSPGEDVKALMGLDDAVLDLSVTPNRGDLLSMLGVAREVFALFPGAEWKDNPLDIKIDGGKEWPGELEFRGISLEDEGCSLYCMGLITGLEQGASPLKIRVLLTLLGMRPISAMVDATNFAMLMLGQPTHAFDAAYLPAREITVRRAREGEGVTTLDGKDHDLKTEDMLITSGGQAVAIAGVMGGENSEILETTKDVFLEAANFDPIRVSRTSRRLGIPSEAAYRFSRTVDHRLTKASLHYIFSLLEEWSAGGTGYAVKYASNVRDEERTVVLTREKLKRYLLTEDMEEASAILARLGLEEVSSASDERAYSVPSWRPDISIEEDLIEEVGRIRGYNEALPSTLPGALHEHGDIGGTTRTKGDVRATLMARGYVELMNYSFVSPSFVKLLRLPSDDRRARPLSLSNPLSVEQSRMRTMLLPGLLRSVKRSVASGWRYPVRAFEIGSVFLPLEQGGHEEVERICGLSYGGRDPRLPYGPSDADDLFTLKADIEALARKSCVSVEYEQGEECFGHRGQTGLLSWEGRRIGYLLRLKPSIEKELDCSPLYAFEIDLEPFESARLPSFREPSPFPPVFRDISLFVPVSESHERVLELIRGEGGSLLGDVRLFDVYTGKGVPDGFRGLAFSLAYRSEDRTLTDEEVDRVNELVRKKMADIG